MAKDAKPASYQEKLRVALVGKTISEVHYLGAWDDGSPVDPDTPQIESIVFTDGTRLEFDGFGEGDLIVCEP